MWPANGGHGEWGDELPPSIRGGFGKPPEVIETVTDPTGAGKAQQHPLPAQRIHDRGPTSTSPSNATTSKPRLPSPLLDTLLLHTGLQVPMPLAL